MNVLDASAKIRRTILQLLIETESELGATMQIHDLATALRYASDHFDNAGNHTRSLRLAKAADALSAVASAVEKGDLS